MNATMHLPRKSIIVAIILTTGLLIWIPSQQRLSQIRRALAQNQAEQLALAGQTSVINKQLGELRKQLTRENGFRDSARADLVNANRSISQADPDAYWSQPPAIWPDWHTNSPYIWVHKTILPQLRVECFAKDGQVKPEVAQVLAVPKAQLDQLNSNLSKLLSDFRSAEIANAQRIDESTPDMRKITVKIDKLQDEGQQLATGLKSALLETLGPQRTDYLIDSAGDWLARQTSEMGKQSMVIAVSRKADGTTRIEKQHSGYIGSAVITLSKETPLEPELVPIPQHLIPFFEEFTTDQPAQVKLAVPH